MSVPFSTTAERLAVLYETVSYKGDLISLGHVVTNHVIEKIKMKFDW